MTNKKNKPQIVLKPELTDSLIKKPFLITNPLYKNLITWFLLLVIFVFAIFLRVEDFSDWQKNPFVFKYQDQYLMTNMDSYYYLKFAKDLQNGTYNNNDENRRVPNGAVRPNTPPLLSMLAANISHISHINLATVAVLMPVFLSSLLLVVIFLLARQFSYNRIAALIAALFSVIALGYITRTRLGVFDTDSMNVVFALLNSYLVLRFALIKSNIRYWFFGATILNTFLYFIWWNTAGSVVLLSALVPLSVAILWFYQEKNTTIKYALWAFLGAFGLFLLYFLGEQLIDYIKQFIFIQNSGFFPRVSGGIGELETTNIIDFIKKTTNNTLLFIVAIIGIAYLVKQQKLKVLLIIAPIILALLPFVAGNRFMIFSAPIIALGIGFFVQLLFDFKLQSKWMNPYLLTIIITSIGIYSSYKYATFKIFEPAILQLKHRPLLNALNTHTPADADIWSDWTLGYPMQYYLNRGSFADGEINDEIFYYLHFPLATKNLALAANFMRFYHQQGKVGMNKLYAITGSEIEAFKLIKSVLLYPPERAKQILIQKLNTQKSFKTADLPDINAWLIFLYPAQNKPLYLLLSHRMFETMGWFSQGKADLVTGKTKDLSLYLSFNGLQENTDTIQNNAIKINKKDGTSSYINSAKNHFASIRTYHQERATIKHYKPLPGFFRGANKRFIFEWRKDIAYGAAMSKEVANTMMNKLFMRQQKSQYFKPVSLQTPQYQIWQVYGDIYEK